MYIQEKNNIVNSFFCKLLKINIHFKLLTFFQMFVFIISVLFSIC